MIDDGISVLTTIVLTDALDTPIDDALNDTAVILDAIREDTLIPFENIVEPVMDDICAELITSVLPRNDDTFNELMFAIANVILEPVIVDIWPVVPEKLDP